jgi:hypothetical protein
MTQRRDDETDGRRHWERVPPFPRLPAVPQRVVAACDGSQTREEAEASTGFEQIEKVTSEGKAT